MNDLLSLFTGADIKMYANDTCLFRVFKGISENSVHLNTGMKSSRQQKETKLSHFMERVFVIDTRRKTGIMYNHCSDNMTTCTASKFNPISTGL